MRRLYGIVFIMVLFVAVINPVVASACGEGEPIGPPPQTRLAVGMQAMVAYTASGYPLRVREQPGLSGKYLTQLYNGARFTVIGGSQAIDNYVWWQVSTPDGKVTGWLAEGEYGEYYVEPVTSSK